MAELLPGRHTRSDRGSRIRSFGTGLSLVVLSLAFTAFPVLLTGIAGAGEKTSIEAESARLDKLRERISELTKQVENVRGERDTRYAQLEKTDRETGKLQKVLRKLDSDAAEAVARLASLEARRKQAQQQLVAVRQVLAGELRAAWLGGRQERIKLLLNQQEPASVGRMLTYQGYLVRARAQRMNEFRSALQDVQQAQQEIIGQQAHIEEVREKQQQQLAHLTELQAEQRKLVAALQEKLDQGNSRLSELQKDEKRINQLVKSLRDAVRDMPAPSGSGTGLRQLRGQLPWPVAGGQVSVPFGARQSDGRMTSRGVHLSVPAGTEVHSVGRGRVVFADWLRGFGLLVIIDHGSGYMSLYGENSSLYKAVGDQVVQGEVIAAAGSSGGQNRTGVYLELRKDGQPVSPESWFRGKPSRQNASSR